MKAEKSLYIVRENFHLHLVKRCKPQGKNLTHAVVKTLACGDMLFPVSRPVIKQGS